MPLQTLTSEYKYPEKCLLILHCCCHVNIAMPKPGAAALYDIPGTNISGQLAATIFRVEETVLPPPLTESIPSIYKRMRATTYRKYNLTYFVFSLSTP
jgi:hypothetical protein